MGSVDRMLRGRGLCPHLFESDCTEKANESLFSRNYREFLKPGDESHRKFRSPAILMFPIPECILI